MKKWLLLVGLAGLLVPASAEALSINAAKNAARKAAVEYGLTEFSVQACRSHRVYVSCEVQYTEQTAGGPVEWLEVLEMRGRSCRRVRVDSRAAGYAGHYRACR